MLTFFLIYLVCGFCIGILAGLFGIGGGVIGIPILLLLFKLQGISQTSAMHLAIGTSFATVIVTNLASLYSHHLKNMINFPIAKKIILGSIVGTMIGVFISIHTHGVYLQAIFGIILIVLAIRMSRDKELKTRSEISTKKLILISTLINILSGMLGLSGSVVIVSYLHSIGIPLRNAIATVTTCIIPAACVGALGFMLANSQDVDFLAFQTGFIYWPAFFGISIASVFTAPLGVKLAHIMSTHFLKKLFSLFLGIIGIAMIYNSLA